MLYIKCGENLQNKDRINAVTFSIYPAYSYLYPCSIRRQFFCLNNYSLNNYSRNYKKKETQMKYTTVKIVFKTYKQKNKRNAAKSAFLSLIIMPQTGIEPDSTAQKR